MKILVSCAGRNNGGTRGKILMFSLAGESLGEFAPGFGITDPRGLRVGQQHHWVYVSNGDNRILAFNADGLLQKSSPQIPGLDPGGCNWGPDGRLYVGSRGHRNIIALGADLDGPVTEFLTPRILPFPRGFAFHSDQRLYFASGIGPNGEGENTLCVFSPEGRALNSRLIDDPELSPLDVIISSDGQILISSEYPFNQPDAASTIREFDASSGKLIRIFHFPRDPAFAQPRGLRFGPDSHLYCVCAHAVAKFDFNRGVFLEAVISAEHLHGQAIEFL